MAAVAHPHPTSTSAQPRPAPRSMDTSRSASISTSASMAPAQPAPPLAKKGKGKKSTDPSEQQKQIQAKIAQLEQDAAGDKEQELEIEREVKKANRELSSLLNSMDGPLTRVEVVQKRYTELLSEMKRTEREHQKAKKRGDQLQKEKDAQRSELNKVTTMKDKLDKLSRDFAKENKKLKDELQKMESTESAAREELHHRLADLVEDVDSCIAQQHQPEPQNPAEIELEELFRQKFKSFVEQYEIRELQFYSLLRTKELEIQYQMARLEQQRKHQEAETLRTHQLTSTYSETEHELRAQLNAYVERSKQDQQACNSTKIQCTPLINAYQKKAEGQINSSNEPLATFRKELEEMSKKNRRLEKENNNLQRNKEVTARNIAEMVQERERMQDDLARKTKEIEEQRKKITRLETLCRGMQAQGRGQVAMAELEEDEEVTESEYEYPDGDGDEDEDEEGSEQYDDDTEDDALEPVPQRRPFGPVPPPPPPPQNPANPKVNGHRQANGQVNGVKR